MGSFGVQVICGAFGALGLIGVIICCTVPHWKMTSFLGANNVISQTTQEGLWMLCVVQSTGQQQCKYNSLLDLTLDLQAGRAMTIISCMLSFMSLLILFCGADFTTCVQNENAKSKLRLVVAVDFVLAGLMVIIPVRWSTHVIVQDVSVHDSIKNELGECIYVGLAAGVLLLLAGGLLCCFSRPKSSSSAGIAKLKKDSSLYENDV